ncbi:hypothetical protein G3O06_30480 [Burkholderia sp. Ac-20345]|uniref:hypothetical protein n=1 Tax=Burkholderia sp. Ac-20345 TaxID=2703891 RepID=UPI00197C8DCE|nr:hypothetical protein [Burkholderia sp. Ac-20345]MBN3781835.1 hypothetical protein [Burkholderia sp. Ac-20345]
MTLSAQSPRLQRYRKFKTFTRFAKHKFRVLCDHNPEAQRFDQIYSFCITPGGRAGGQNARQFEVFFGARPYDSARVLDSSMRRTVRLLAEHGATLEFMRDDLGRVHVFLHPAVSEGTKPLEDFIKLGIVEDPAKLLNNQVLSRYFRWLIAYMQCTCLEGQPTLRDRLMVSVLRLFRQRSVNGRLRRTRISKYSGNVTRWVLTVGLSGTLFSVIQWFFAPPTDVRILAEPPRTQAQRTDLVNLTRDNATHLETMERTLEVIRARLNASASHQPPPLLTSKQNGTPHEATR